MRRVCALRRGPPFRAPDRVEEARRLGDAMSAPRAPSRSAACRPYRHGLHRGRTVQRRPRLARPRGGRSRPPPPRRRRVAREASGTHSPPGGASGVAGARSRVPSVGNNQPASCVLSLLSRGEVHARGCAVFIAPPRPPVVSHGARSEGHAPLRGLWPDATLEWHQKQATFQPPAREYDLRALRKAWVNPEAIAGGTSPPAAILPRLGRDLVRLIQDVLQLAI